MKTHEKHYYYAPRGVLITTIGVAIDGEREKGSHAVVLTPWTSVGPCPPDFPDVDGRGFKAVGEMLDAQLQLIDEHAIRALADVSPCSTCGGTGKTVCSYCEGKHVSKCECSCGHEHEALCVDCDADGKQECGECLTAMPFRFGDALYDRKLLASVVRNMLGCVSRAGTIAQIDKDGDGRGFALVLESANGTRGAVTMLADKVQDYPVLDQKPVLK